MTVCVEFNRGEYNRLRPIVLVDKLAVYVDVENIDGVFSSETVVTISILFC